MRIVVDASVAKAAGTGRPGAGPPSPECVAALEAISQAGLRVVFNAELNREWQKHQRPFSTTWLKTMISRKRMEVVRENWPGEGELLGAAAQLPGQQPEAVAKDIHLIGLAMLTDRRVVSLDDAQSRLLRVVLPSIPTIGTVHWASPKANQTVPWLRAGAPEEPALQLGTP